MKYGSVCSGIEGATLAWRSLGWQCAFMSETSKQPRAVLKHHYPTTPLHADFTTIKAGDYDPIDVLVGGTPCQDFSIAGLRKGFAGDRGNLTFEFVHLAARLCPKWLVWENVPGCLSIDGGVGFGTFLGMLAKLGYGFAYRVLDAQYAGLAQRRERVFVVANLGDWRRAAAVLFERESLSGNPAPRREAGQRTAGTLSARTEGGGFPGTDEAADGYDVAVGATLQAGGHSTNPLDETLITHSLRGEGFDASEDGTGRGVPLVPIANAGVMPAVAIPLQEVGKRTGKSTDDVRAGIGIGIDGDPMFTLQSSAQHGVAVALRGREGGGTAEMGGDLAGSLRASQGGGDNPHVLTTAVRRLMPVECCRLQGVPDDYLDVIYNGKPLADGPKYKMLGNGFAVPVITGIGERIQLVEWL